MNAAEHRETALQLLERASASHDSPLYTAQPEELRAYAQVHALLAISVDLSAIRENRRS